MAKNTRDPEQLYRIDGKNVFCEVMANGLGIDKVCINFVEYNAAASRGDRIKNGIGFYMPIYTAKRLSLDILSGRIALLGKAAKKKAEEAGQKYAKAVFEQLGGTPSKFAKDGIPVARSLTITPGSAQPWILCAKQGPGHETKEGLIVMDKCEAIIRVPMSNDIMKELAVALSTAFDIWAQLRFVPVVAPMMQKANAERQAAIDAKKAESSPAFDAADAYFNQQ